MCSKTSYRVRWGEKAKGREGQPFETSDTKYLSFPSYSIKKVTIQLMSFSDREFSGDQYLMGSY